MVLDPRRRIGRRIRQMREQHHLTQQAVAAKLGCSFQLIQAYERGDKLSIGRVNTLAEIFSVNPEWLLAGTGAKESEPISEIVGFYSRQPQISNRVVADACVKAMCGLPPDAELDLETWLKQVHEDDLPRVNFELAKCLHPRGDGMFNAEYTLIGLDGIERRIVDLSRTIFDAAHRAVLRIGIMVDVSRLGRGHKNNEITKTLQTLRRMTVVM